MPRSTTKLDLVEQAKNSYEQLNLLISNLTEEELNIMFDFSKSEKRKEAHWQRDKNLRDILIHLYEWHQLILKWIESNQKGDRKSFLPAQYNWKTYGDMNLAFWERHQSTSLAEAKRLFKQSHEDVMQCMNQFSNDELFSRNIFEWVSGSTLGSYFVSGTSSHYQWAITKLKAHQKYCKEIKTLKE